ncbi:DUF5681 domain-containing protein [Sphingopyxis solisilvae]|uniref:DUF5681 domain-containing protein n=1 Tax=Sphingopyxis solisilvae TaxID=1886788 RepID=UPI001892A869|nr:DUF5681 domain-containing protein [Sphingopyxis solisilvae]
MSDDRDGNGRFKKGVCPNPKGRPRKAQTVSRAILDAAKGKVMVSENGKRRRVRKIEAAATQVANKGAAGDLRAGKLLLDYAARAEADERDAAPLDAALSLSDQEIASRFLAEYRRHLEGNGA